MYRSSTLLSNFVWTTNGLWRASSAPVDTGFFARGGSITRSPTVYRSHYLPKNMYSCYVCLYFLDQSIQQTIYLISNFIDHLCSSPWLSLTWRNQCFYFHNWITYLLYTVGPLIIESLWANKRVSTGALGALDDPLIVHTKIWKSGWVPVDNIYHL